MNIPSLPRRNFTGRARAKGYNGCVVSMRRTLLIFALSFLVAAPAGAQPLKLSFNAGRVSVDAARFRFARSSTSGRSSGHQDCGRRTHRRRAVDAEVDRRARVAGPRNHPAERGRLHGGATRPPGASMYDRILVMATSSGPPPARRPGPRPQSHTGTQRFIPPRQQAAGRQR